MKENPGSDLKILQRKLAQEESHSVENESVKKKLTSKKTFLILIQNK